MHVRTCWSQKITLQPFYFTVQILCIGTDRSQQTVQTKIRLLLKKQSDQGLRCLTFHQHLLGAFTQCYIKLFYFRTIVAIVCGVPNFRIFTVCFIYACMTLNGVTLYATALRVMPILQCLAYASKTSKYFQCFSV